MTRYQSTKRKLKFLQTANAKVRTVNFWIGAAIALMIMATPFLYHLYLNAPDQEGEVWHTWFGTISSGGYLTVQGFMYNLVTKSYILFFISLFYLTSKYAWKWSLLVPLTVNLFQLASVLNDNVQYVDNFEFVHSLPLVLPIVVLQTYIAYRLWNRKIAIDLTESIQQEIELTTNNATPVNDKPQQ